MNRRWVLALTAAVGVGLLTASFVMERGRGNAGPAAEFEVPSLASSHDGPACDANNKPNLDLTLKDVNGADVRLSDYKGKLVLVNFWATWCGPCKVEIPDFVDLYAEYKDRGFVILGVLSEDTPTPQQLQSFTSEFRMSYPILQSSPELEDAFGSIYALPTSFLVGRDGAVCGKQLGPVSKKALESSIKALL